MRRGVREGGSGLGQTPFPHKDWGDESQNSGGPRLERPALGSVRRGVGAGSGRSHLSQISGDEAQRGLVLCPKLHSGSVKSQDFTCLLLTGAECFDRPTLLLAGPGGILTTNTPSFSYHH